jgi:hypothetical protein
MRNSYSDPDVGVGTNTVQAPSNGAGRRLAMNSVDGWFSNNKDWIEFIIATVLLWLLMMTAIHGLNLRSVS